MTVPHWELLSRSVKGPGKKENQDRFDVVDAGDGTLVLAVADGHGSAAHARSDVGARFAVEAFLRHGRAFAERAREAGGLRQLYHDACDRVPRDIVRDWREEVLGHERAHPPEDAHQADALLPYGTTLLGAVLAPDLLVAWQLGDGDLMLVEADGSVSAPLAPLEPELGDETESLCSRQARELVRVHWAPVADPERLPRMLLLATDGLSKSFAADDGFARFVGELSDRLEAEGAASIGEALPGWLERASRYSGDDTTLVAVWRPSHDGGASSDGPRNQETEEL
ncbi:PP2C family serine/threonine-protein phosphatase [Streptomyces sp. URMC 126]|uniref:PP2C family serine/threonine-protein phosphatase n=1 Tax=Streptomyces sp. URMC 126 TaxID=3423401 RepID=UPI003F19CDFD